MKMMDGLTADLLAKLGKRQHKLNFECSLRAEIIIIKNHWNKVKVKSKLSGFD